MNDLSNSIKEQLIEKKILKPVSEMERVYLDNAKDRGVVNKWALLTDIRSQVNIFLEQQPLFYDKAGLFWIWNHQESYYEKADETEVLLRINEVSGRDTINSKSRTEILEALKQEGRKRHPNQFKKEWIQFKDQIIDYTNGNSIPATPVYFCTNPIPYKMGKSYDTPVIDRLFTEWVGNEAKKSLYEILAYSLITDYPLHRIFCLIGSGMNGKSCFLGLLKKFLGIRNITSTELDTLITSRFEITKLHKKLACLLGETNFNELSKTSILKKVTGGDLIGFEYKNKTPFDDINYAKIIIATNNLPTTTDKTIGFYRRWLIIDFNNKFSEKMNILNEIPEEEYENLAYKCITTLNTLMIKREFTNEGNIEERMKRYEEKSNPFDKFWRENIEEDLNADIPSWELIKRLNEWCLEHKFRELGERTVATHMKEKQIENKLIRKEWFEQGFTTSKPIRCWVGIKWKN